MAGEVAWPMHNWVTGLHWWLYRDDDGVWCCGGCGIRQDRVGVESIKTSTGAPDAPLTHCGIPPIPMTEAAMRETP